MLPDFSDKTFLVRCDDCGFRYRVLQASAVHPVCPSCGAEKPQKIIEHPQPAERTGGGYPQISKPVRNEKNVPYQSKERWGVLFIAVCIQWAVILVSPLYIYYQLQKQGQENGSGIVAENMVSEGVEIKSKAKTSLQIPDVPPQVNPPAVQQKPESNVSVAVKSAEVTSAAIKSAEVKSGNVNPIDEIAVLLENRHKAERNREIKPVSSKVTEQNTAKLPGKTEPVSGFESAFSAPLPAVLSHTTPFPAVPSSILPSPAIPLPATSSNAAGNNAGSNNVKRQNSKEADAQYKEKLNAAEKKLNEASSLIPISPDSALEKGVEAVQLFRQLGQNVPSSAYWLIAQAFASQGWGKALSEHTLPVVSMDISSDSRWLLSSDREHGVTVRDIMQQNPQQGNTADTGSVPLIKLLFTSDNRCIAGCAEDGTVRIFDVTQKKPADAVKVLKTAFYHPLDLQISPDGKWLACCGSEYSAGQNRDAVELWNIEQLPDGIIPQSIILRGHEKPIRTMVFSPDSGLLITGSDDTAARVYNLKPEFPGACQAVLKGHNDGITAIAVAPNGKWLATGSRDQTIRLWSLTDVNAVPNSVVLNGHIGWVSALVIDRNSDVLISGSYDRTIRLWSIPQGNIQKAKDVESIEVQNDQGTVVKLLLSKDGRILVSLGSDASVRLRELNRSIGGAGREIHPKNTLMLRNKILPIQQVMFTPDDRSLVFSYLNLKDESDSGIRIWSLQLDGLLESIKN